jgi:hypothetical protein
MMDGEADSALGTATEQNIVARSELFSLLGKCYVIALNILDSDHSKFFKAVHPEGRSWESGGQFSLFFLL